MSIINPNFFLYAEDEKENQKLERVEVERISLKWRFQHGVYTSFAPTNHAAMLVCGTDILHTVTTC